MQQLSDLLVKRSAYSRGVVAARGGLVVLLGVLASCSDAVAPTSDRPNLAASADLKEVLAPRTSGRPTAAALHKTPEVLFLEINRTVPEFAGFYLDSDGRPVIAVTNEAAKGAAAAAVLAIWDGAPGVNSGALTFRVVPNSFTQLARWRDALLRFPHTDIVSYDADERTNTLAVGVRPDGDMTQARAAASRAAGAPLEFVTVFRDAKRPVQAGMSLRDSIRPVVGGLAIGREPGGVCSAGFNVRRPSDPAEYFITASHCTYYPFEPDPQYGTWWQPYRPALTSYSGYASLGSEFLDPRSTPGTPCNPFYSRCRWADAAMIKYTTPTESGYGIVARTTPIGARSSSIDGSITLAASNWRVVGEYPRGWMYVGNNVHKVGQTTGWTWGQITRTGAGSLSVQGDANGLSVAMPDLVETDVYVLGGDSGGPVFAWWGGSGYGPYDIYLMGVVSKGGGNNMGFDDLEDIHKDLGSFLVTPTPITFPLR